MMVVVMVVMIVVAESMLLNQRIGEVATLSYQQNLC